MAHSVLKLLSTLKADKSPGPDKIHLLFLKKCTEVLSCPLYLLLWMAVIMYSLCACLTLCPCVCLWAGSWHHNNDVITFIIRLFILLLLLPDLQLFEFRSFICCTDLNLNEFFKLRTDYRHRGHKYKLFLPGCRSNTRRNFFTYHTGRIWNNLPADNTDFSNLNSFKW